MKQARLYRRVTVRMTDECAQAGSNGYTYDLRAAPVSTLMSRPVVTVFRDDSLDAALRILSAHGVRHLAVVDRNSRALGVLTDRQVTAWWVLRPMTFDSIRVSSAYAGPQPFVTADATVADAARTMRRCGTDVVVVVDHDVRPIGVVTTSDLVAVLAKPRPR